MQVVVHGGAGSRPPDPAGRRRALDAAASTGAGAATPVDAVVAAVRELESDPRFNAGVGSAVQSDGRIRTDAGLMSGDRRAGAACAMPGVEHPVTVARAVREETPHVLLAGERAVAFAAAVGVETGVDLWTDRTRERWDRLDPPGDDPAAHLPWVREQFGGTDGTDGNDGSGGTDRAGPRSSDADAGRGRHRPDRGDSGQNHDHDHDHDHDTVGAVAADGERVAAATSTGGRWCALAGRVGDVPQVGCGFYAGPAGAASATGHGEDIARTTLARQAVALLGGGHDPDEAAERAVSDLAASTGGTAGVIVVDPDGTAGTAHNAAAMGTSDARE